MASEITRVYPNATRGFPHKARCARDTRSLSTEIVRTQSERVLSRRQRVDRVGADTTSLLASDARRTGSWRVRATHGRSIHGAFEVIRIRRARQGPKGRTPQARAGPFPSRRRECGTVEERTFSRGA